MIKKIIIIILLTLCVLVYADSGRVLDGSDNPYYITTIYDGNDLRGIQYAQSNDAMYLVHPNYPPQKLIRYDHATWTIADVNWENGPFLDENTDTDITITPDATTGDVNLLTTGAIFDANHVDALWRLTHPVDSNTISGTFTATGLKSPTGNVNSGTVVEDQNSATLAVALNQNYRITTNGFWMGTLYIQKSYDDGTTWIPVDTYTGNSDNNLVYSNTETVDDAEYRLHLEDHWGVQYHRDEYYYTFTYTMVAVGYNRQGIVKITSVTDANNAVAEVLYDLGGTSATYHWAEGAWSDYRGFPRAICFYQNRLCLAGSAYQPNMLWCSQSGDYENMSLGTGLDNEAIAREIGAAGQNPIMWIKDRKGIIAGTTGAIIRIGTPSSKYIFTPSTITSERSVETGTCNIQPGLTNSSIVYVDRNRKKVRDLNYDVSVDDLVSPDLTIYSDDITDPNIQEMAWQKRPDEIGWFVKDSNIVTMTYNPAQGVAAWTEIATDGNYVSVCVIPGVDEDEVWVAVERDCNDYIMIEKFHKQNWKDDVWFVDSGLEYSGVAATSITGLGHLEGKEVQVFSDANGFVGDFTVSSGSITLSSSETQCVAGLGYTATIKTMPIEVTTQLGPSIGLIKNIRRVTLCLYESEGGRYGYDTMYDIIYPTYTTDFYTGLSTLGLDTGFRQEVYLIIDQNEPLPLGITGIAINKYELSNDN